jgi:hypothetical protein
MTPQRKRRLARIAAASVRLKDSLKKACFYRSIYSGDTAERSFRKDMTDLQYLLRLARRAAPGS